LPTPLLILQYQLRLGDSRSQRAASAPGRFHATTIQTAWARCNATIGELLRQLNEKRPIRRLGVTRRALLEELDRPHLKELPGEPYCFAEWRLRRVEVEAHFYSVPYRFARREVEVRLTPRTVEVFSRASGSPRICAPAAIIGTPPSPITSRSEVPAASICGHQRARVGSGPLALKPEPLGK
jgi:hypothetical protein